MVELLLALALTTIIASFVLAGFGLARRAWLNSAAGEATGEIEAGAMRLRELVTKTVPALSISPEDGLARLSFDGQPQSLTFVTLSEGEAFPGGLMRVRLFRGQAPRTDNHVPIMLSTAVFRSDPRVVVELEPVALFRNVAGFSLKYFGPYEVGRRPEWQSEWSKRGHLPQLVLAEFDIEDNGQVRHLALPIPLRHGAWP